LTELVSGEMTPGHSMRSNLQADSPETSRSDFGKRFPVQSLTNFSGAIEEPEERQNYVEFSGNPSHQRANKNCA
jgi:hypothetical protein